MHGVDATHAVANVGVVDAGNHYNVALWDGTDWITDLGVATVQGNNCVPWYSANGDVFFVTYSTLQDTTWRRKTGGVWSILETLGIGSGSEYQYCHGHGGTCFVCGDTPGGLFVKKWDGAITQIHSGVENPYNSLLYALSPTSLWYARWNLGTSDDTVIEYWDGATWTETFRSNIGNGVRSCWFADANNGWMGCTPDVGVVPQILYWNGSTWTPQALPGTVSADDVIYGMWGISASEIYATVHWGDLLLKFDGVSWTDITPVGWPISNPGGLFAYSVASPAAYPLKLPTAGLYIDEIRGVKLT